MSLYLIGMRLSHAYMLGSAELAPARSLTGQRTVKHQFAHDLPRSGLKISQEMNHNDLEMTQRN
jgi:hypothetical protein